MSIPTAVLSKLGGRPADWPKDFQLSKTQARITNAREKVEFQIFADGNLRKSVAESVNQPLPAGEDQGTDGVVRLGLAQIDPNEGTTWSGLVTVASTTKRVSSDFAATVLVPGAGGGFSSGLQVRVKDITAGIQLYWSSRAEPMCPA